MRSLLPLLWIWFATLGKRGGLSEILTDDALIAKQLKTHDTSLDNQVSWVFSLNGGRGRR